MVEITKNSRERRLRAWELRKVGKSFVEIGEEFGVCRSTAKSMSDAGQRQEARKLKYSYDLKCIELARYFYPNISEDGLRDLAQQFQDAAESYQRSSFTDGGTHHE